MKKPKVAIVYDRVNKWGGAERVLLALHELFPDAPLYTSVYHPQSASWAEIFPQIFTSFLQKVPLARQNHEYFAPLMPIAFESFDFSHYDLVVSVSSEAAKGIIASGGTIHLSYCLTPTRYLWNGHKEYLKTKLARKMASPLVSYLRNWDKIAAQRADRMIGISTEVKKRIKKYYAREVDIIFPPITSFQTSQKAPQKKSYYLVVSRLVRYKRIDLAIEAFNKLKLPLVVVGTGREIGKLKKMANKNIRFTGPVTDKQLSRHYAEAKALIFPQIEDFGIVAIEAQTFGTPVIAYRAGGALDTVLDGETGVFFDKQDVTSLVGAVKLLDKIQLRPQNIIENATRFSKERFVSAFKKEIQKL